MKKIIGYFIMTISIILFITTANAAASNKASEDFANIVFFAYFENSDSSREQADKDYLINNSQKLLDIYDGTSKRSFTNYLKNISYGKFNVKNIFPQVTDGKIEPIKITGINIEKAYDMNVDEQIIDQILNKYPNISGQLDYNADGFVDNLTIILKSRDGLNAKTESTMVSHKSNYSATRPYSNKTISVYNILGTESILGKESSSVSLGNDAGVIAHEFLHSIGYPDLYRTRDGDDMPVYVWDIMASANHGMSYPLAFLRSQISNWIDIETITSSRTNLRLDLQSNSSGNQAYIIKSPLNDYEFFVVEYRKKGATGDMESYDRFIGDSGIIVYRVDTTVPNYSNSGGSTGIYVFRPHTSNSEMTNVYNAALSDSVGKNDSIGTSDMSKGLLDGALTFSDGSNSGIVIKNVKTNDGYMTLDVIVPNESQFDIWKNTNIPNITINNTIYFYKNSIVNYNNKLYSINYANENRNSTSTTIYTRVLNDDTWNTLGSQNLNLSSQSEPKIFVYNNELYFANLTNDYPGTLKLYKWNNNSWIEVKTLATNVTNYFDISVINNKIYFVTSETPNTSNPFSVYSNLYLYENDNVTNLGTYLIGTSGEVKISNIGNTIYTGVMKGDSSIHIFKYNNSIFTELKQYTSSDNSFDMASLNNKIYITFGNGSNGKFGLGTYDGTNFSEISTELTLSMASLVISQENLYVTGVNKNKLYTFAYNEHTKLLTLEGNSIATGQIAEQAKEASFDTSLASIGNIIYIMYKDNQDKTAYVKKKEVTNHLLSITLTPPTQTTYKVGDTLSTNGLKVTATYINGTKEVTSYTIDGFDATEPGTYTAIVSFEGLYKTFNYVIEVNKEILVDGIHKDENGIIYIIKDNQIDTNYTGLLYCFNNWHYFYKGYVDYNYKGMATNENGTWYVNKGIIDFKYYGAYKDSSGIIYIIERSKVDTSKNGLIYQFNNWYYFKNGVLDKNFNGITTNENGTWKVDNGKILFNHTEIIWYMGYWRMFINNRLESNYTGIGKNLNGEWLVTNGIVDFKYNGMYKNENNNIYYIKGSKVQTDYNGLTYTNNNWYYFEDGRTNYKYTGVVANEYGTWLVIDGIVNFKYNGMYKNEKNDIYYIKGSKVQTDYSGLTYTNNNWYYFENGRTNYKYTGLATNENGTWYVNKGIVDFSYSGTYTSGSKSYKIKKGKVV